MKPLTGSWTPGRPAALAGEPAAWRDEAAGIVLAGGAVAHSGDGRWVAALDGAVFNRADLLRRFDEGEVSSASAIAEAVARWGVDRTMLALDGKVAAALWDRRDRVLHLVRDRLGEAALFWARADGGGIVFGSALRQVAGASGRAEVDRGAVAALVSQGAIPGTRTVFAGVSGVPPGGVLTAKGADVAARTYWSADERANAVAGSFAGGAAAAAERLNALLRASVALRLEEAGAMPAVLDDGGPASALLAAMARDLGGADVAVIGPAGAPGPEVLARMAMADTPLTDCRAVRTYLLAAAAGEAGASMALGADGGCLALEGRGIGRGEPAVPLPPWRRWLDRLLPADEAAPAGDPAIRLSEAQCRWSDGSGRAYGLDVRRPFLGQAVIELHWSLPEALWRTDDCPFAHLAARYLPDCFPGAPEPEIASWLSGPLAPWVGDTLSPHRLRQRGLVSPGAVEAARRKGRWHEVWAALMVEAWADTL